MTLGADEFIRQFQRQLKALRDLLAAQPERKSVVGLRCGLRGPRRWQAPRQGRAQVKQPLYWQQAPRQVVRELLPKLSWQRQGAKSAARDTAALMLYVALLFEREEEYDEITIPAW